MSTRRKPPSRNPRTTTPITNPPTDPQPTTTVHNKQTGHRPATGLLRIRLFAVVPCAFFAAVHAVTVAGFSYSANGSDLVIILAFLLAPLINSLLLPGTLFAAPHRWLTSWSLTWLVIPYLASITLVAAETWVLYRLWVVEYPHRRRNKLKAATP